MLWAHLLLDAIRAQALDLAADDDVDALHRDAATRGGIALDDQQAAAAGGPGILAGVAFDHDLARHHVLADAGSGRTVHGDGGTIIHAAAVIADAAAHIDADRLVDADGNRMA